MAERATGRRDSIFGPMMRPISSGSRWIESSCTPAGETSDTTRPSRTKMSTGPLLREDFSVPLSRRKIRNFACSSEYVPAVDGFPMTFL